MLALAAAPEQGGRPSAAARALTSFLRALESLKTGFAVPPCAGSLLAGPSNGMPLGRQRPPGPTSADSSGAEAAVERPLTLAVPGPAPELAEGRRESCKGSGSNPGPAVMRRRTTPAPDESVRLDRVKSSTPRPLPMGLSPRPLAGFGRGAGRPSLLSCSMVWGVGGTDKGGKRDPATRFWLSVAAPAAS